MDKESLKLLSTVWKHSQVAGNVWVPHIASIGVKGKERFREGAALAVGHRNKGGIVPHFKEEVDWYWTPAVSSSDSRKAKEYPAQRVLWVDCDESYDDKLLTKLRPTFIWETSPGHKQAIWLMKEPVSPSEFHRDGLMGMLTQALGGDKSGVDIGQLLRVPGTWHHKRKPFHGKVLRNSTAVHSRGQLLTSVARGLGFKPGLASELGADDPYGDRSKVLWRFSRNAAELGLSQDLTFKLIKACKWNKWKDEPELLREDIAKAYSAQPKESPTPAATETSDPVSEELQPWGLATVGQFGPVLHKPINWVVPGIIPEAGCGLLVAAPKVGKTRIAIELALGIATGRKPLGISTGKPQAVGFLSLEDGDYLFSLRLNGSLNVDKGRHQYHWDGHIAPDLVWHPPQPMPLFTAFNPIDLSESDDKQRLYETILQYGLRLIVIDTLSMAIGKADVSQAKDMYSILKDIKLIAKETGCAVLFIHHTRKRVFERGESIQEMVLGSTALHAWADFVMSLAAPEEDSDLLRLGVQTKMGNNQHHVTQDLKIIKRPTVVEE